MNRYNQILLLKFLKMKIIVNPFNVIMSVDLTLKSLYIFHSRVIKIHLRIDFYILLYILYFLFRINMGNLLFLHIPFLAIL